MNEKIVLTAKGYDRVDGRNAYQSAVKKLTLGTPIHEENKKMQIAAQLWRENKNGELEISMELPIHQVFDLMIFLAVPCFISRRLTVSLCSTIQTSLLWSGLACRAAFFRWKSAWITQTSTRIFKPFRSR
ncbi:hypothetical protein C823_006807 [Eubacterium plexicaudatum ASF492]|nr:hypothetical protein C823_006807 [Eubacterium plexicaudatum ASF492]